MTDPTFREDLINRLFRIPVRVSAAVLLAAMVLGLVVGGVLGGILLGAVLVVLTAMLVLLWPDVSPVERLMRLALLLLVVAATVVRLAPPA